MSILIPGMEMPKDGEMLVLCVGYNGKVLHPIEFATEDFLFAETGKTAIELPPHGRLGDLDKLDYAFTALRFNGDGSLNHWDDRKNWCLHGSEIEMLLANAPTIIPAEGGGTDNG